MAALKNSLCFGSTIYDETLMCDYKEFLFFVLILISLKKLDFFSSVVVIAIAMKTFENEIIIFSKKLPKVSEGTLAIFMKINSHHPSQCIKFKPSWLYPYFLLPYIELFFTNKVEFSFKF